VDEYDVTLTHISGKSNVLADCFLRLPLMASPTVSAKEAAEKGHPINFTKLDIPKDTKEILEKKRLFSISMRTIR